MSQPLVSVVIPVYKCQAYFHDALQSVLTQTYRNFEIVVVDSSNELNKNLLAPYGDRIRYYYQKPSGVAAARNLGIKFAHGELVALLDADDTWQPDKLSAQVTALLQFPEAGFVFTDKRGCDAHGKIADGYTHSLGEWFAGHRVAETDLAYGRLYRELLRTNSITTSSVLVRKDILDKVGLFDEAFPIAEDYDLWLRIAQDHTLLFVNRVLTTYREHPDGLSGPAEIRHDRWASASISVRDKHLRQNWIAAEHLPLVKEVQAQESWELGLGYFTRNYFKEARAYFRHSVRYRAFDVRSWMYWSASFLPLSLVGIIRSVKRRGQEGLSQREAGDSLPENRLSRNGASGMNVLIVVPWDQEFGGVASVVGNLAVLLQKKGHRICFLNPGIGDGLRTKITKWKFPGYELNLRLPLDRRVPVKSAAAFAYYLLPTLRRLHAVLRDNKIDIVNIHYPGEQCVYFAVLRRLLSFKLVVSVHGTDLLPSGKPESSYSWAIRFLMKAADLLVAPSRNTLEHVLAKFPHLRKKALCIHNGVNLNEFEPSNNGTSPAGEYVLCVASHHSYKAIDVLIKAFQRVRLLHEKVELRLAGDGPLRGQLEELARHMGLSNQIKFLGWQDPKQIRKLLQECSLVVLPSRAESFGIVLLEALSCKKPIVASAVDGIPEVIRNGVTGTLVEPEDPGALSEAIVEMLNDKPRADRMANAGYESVKQHFQWELAVEKYETAFQKLLA